MSNMLYKLAAINHKLTHWALLFSAAGLILMTLIIGWQVFARYVLNASPAWSETAALLLMLYYILLAASVGVYERFHLGLKILMDSLSQPYKHYLDIFNHLLIFLFGMIMMINGTRLAIFTTEHIIPTLHISRAYAYWPFAAAGLLICFFALERILIAAFQHED